MVLPLALSGIRHSVPKWPRVATQGNALLAWWPVQLMMTTGLLPAITATTELWMPRPIPITLPMKLYPSQAASVEQGGLLRYNGFDCLPTDGYFLYVCYEIAQDGAQSVPTYFCRVIHTTVSSWVATEDKAL